MHPNMGMIYSCASVSASLTGQHQYSISLAQQGVSRSPNAPYAYLALAQAYGYAGQTEKIPELIAQAQSLNKYMCPYETAINHIILGEINTAFSLFERAVESRSNCLLFARNDLRLLPIKNDPRYQALLTRIGLDDASINQYEGLQKN